MGLIREPKHIDFTIESEPWSKEELADFRKLMNALKSKKQVASKSPSKQSLRVKTTKSKRVIK